MSASVTSTVVEPTSIESVGWYVAWRKRNGTAAASTSASGRAPTSARTVPADACARESGSAVTVRTVARLGGPAGRTRQTPRCSRKRRHARARQLARRSTLTRQHGTEPLPAPVRDRRRALPLGRPRHPRHDRRGPHARARGLRPLRDRAGRRRARADAPRPHGRGEPHEVRLPLRRRRGLGQAAPPVPARARAQADRRRARLGRAPRPRAARGHVLRRRRAHRPVRRGGAAARRLARERQRERAPPARPL